MANSENDAKHAAKREFIRYLISGFSAVGTDLVAYWATLSWFGPSPAKAFSFVSATCVAYTMNKFWTFKKKHHSWQEMAKFATLYAVSLGANVAVNRGTLMLIDAQLPQFQHYELQLGWLMATGTSTVLNYIGQKFWVFK